MSLEASNPAVVPISNLAAKQMAFLPLSESPHIDRRLSISSPAHGADSKDKRDNDNLQSAVERYQEAAEKLEEKLLGVFKRHERKTGNKLWEPSVPLRSKADIPQLTTTAEHLQRNIENLIPEFDPHQNEREVWNKLRHGITKFVEWTIPPLKNFLIVAQTAQSVSENIDQLIS